MQSPLAFSKLFLKKTTKNPTKSLNLRLRTLDPSVVYERLALMSIHLKENQLKKAEILFNRTWKTNPLDIKAENHIELINAFIRSHLREPSKDSTENEASTQRAWDWYMRINELKSTPNIETFGLLMSEYLKVGNLSKCMVLLKDFEKRGLSVKQLLQFDGVKEFELELLSILKEFPGLKVPENFSHELLLSAIQDKYEEKKISNFEEEAQSYLGVLKGRKKEVVQTGAIGVRILKKTLGELANSEHSNLYEKQLWLEERAHAAALEEVEEFMKRLPESIRKITHLPSNLVWEWNQKLNPAIENLLKVLSDSIDEKTKTKVTYLKLLPVSTLSRITIAEFLKLQSKRNDDEESTLKEKNGLRKSLAVVMGIGKSIEREYNLRQLKKNKKLIKANFGLHKLHSDGKLFNMKVRSIAKELQDSYSVDWTPCWGQKTLVEIGTDLANELIKCAIISVRFDNPEDPEEKIVKDEPAFKHKIVSDSNCRKVGYIEYHPALYDLILQQPLQTQPWLLPMITHPAPWVKWNSGGYLSQRDEVIRLDFNPEHRKEIVGADKSHNLDAILRSLDVLGSTAWKINTKVLEIALEFWQRGIDAPHLPAKFNDPAPVKPSSDIKDSELNKQYRIALKKHQHIIQNNFSQRCDVHYKIEVAKAFKDEIIYFPHNMDFRGRAYPMPPHLNHLGNDLCRGLLMFANGKPLGPNGLKWLKIQIGSLMGYDKHSFEDRIAFVDKHLDDVLDSAKRPFDGSKWWLNAEEPWQCLAACFELSAALQIPNPEEYISHMPIHQDGTCNGLQHYAALGGDEIGAKQVNMVPANAPQDLYSAVAAAVQKLVDKDIGDNVPEAELMKHRINRKLVKQTVMTNTYGVTFVGARRQVSNRLEEAKSTDSNPLTDEELRRCSYYITSKIFQCMGEMFSGAKNTQLWLNKAAKLISVSIEKSVLPEGALKITEKLLRLGIIKSVEESESQKVSKNPSNLVESAILDEEELFEVVEPQEADIKTRPNSNDPPSRMSSVAWTTPIGLPIVQPYRYFKTQDVDTVLQSFNVADPNIPQPVNSLKQSSAFPPNFIHSLDACHMMLSALRCQESGLTFASVHDSYWTHACDVNTMSSIIREEFINLHQRPLLRHLLSEFQLRYANHYIPVTVEIPDHLSSQFGQWLKSAGIKKSSSKVSKIKAWAPLSFEDPPEKGKFDIELVKKSKYFFH